MALPITPTPILKGKDAAKFAGMVCEDAKHPIGPTPTPKLDKARELIRKYAQQQQK